MFELTCLEQEGFIETRILITYFLKWPDFVLESPKGFKNRLRGQRYRNEKPGHHPKHLSDVLKSQCRGWVGLSWLLWGG